MVGKLKLILQELPPYVFRDVYFEIFIKLIEEDSSDIIHIDLEKSKYEIKILLCISDTTVTAFTDSLLEIEGNTNPQLAINEELTVKLRLRSKSAGETVTEVERYYLLLEIRSHDNVLMANVLSSTVLLVQYKLDIKGIFLPKIWYKDEGGRDKCIEIMVQLLDSNNQVVTSRVVPLKIQLVYFGGGPVVKQDILKISPESKICIEKSGIALIKFRIEDVSKNHQRQLFQIRIAPDLINAPHNSDICYTTTPSIEVRSKRTKRSRDKTSYLDDDGDNDVPYQSPGHSLHPHGLSTTAITQLMHYPSMLSQSQSALNSMLLPPPPSSQPFSLQSQSISQLPHTQSAAHNQQNYAPAHPTQPALHSQLLRAQQTHPQTLISNNPPQQSQTYSQQQQPPSNYSISMQVANNTNQSFSSNQNQTPQQQQQQQQPIVAHNPGGATTTNASYNNYNVQHAGHVYTPHSVTDLTTSSSSSVVVVTKKRKLRNNLKNVQKAMDDVVNWAGVVISGMENIQWRNIGYETLPNGEPDLARPLYSIPNPNRVIADITQKYHEAVMEGLRVVILELQSAGEEEDKEAEEDDAASVNNAMVVQSFHNQQQQQQYVQQQQHQNQQQQQQQQPQDVTQHYMFYI